MRRAGGWRGAICGGLALFVPACGFKTLPVPPREVFPAPIADLRYELDAERVTLSWSVPQRTRNGGPLSPVASYRILRGVVSDEEYCPSCPPPFSEEFELPASRVAAGRGRASYVETLPRPGWRYFYKVRPDTGWHLPGDDSNAVSFLWLSPAKSPRQVIARPEEGGVALSWQAPDSYLDGTPIDGPLRYRVARSTAGSDYLPLGEAAQGEKSYRDQGLVNGQSYSYQVTAIRAGGEAEANPIPGPASVAVVAIPVDLTPPAPPTELSVVGLDQAVRLSWGLELEEELGGYRVYRRLATASKAELLATVAGREFTFVDRQPPEGGEKWYYSLTAFDRAEPPNESAPSREIEFKATE